MIQMGYPHGGRKLEACKQNRICLAHSFVGLKTFFRLVANLKNSEISPKYPEFSLFLKNLPTFLHGQSWLGWGAAAPSSVMCILQVTGLTHPFTQFAWACGCLSLRTPDIVH